MTQTSPKPNPPDSNSDNQSFPTNNQEKLDNSTLNNPLDSPLSMLSLEPQKSLKTKQKTPTTPLVKDKTTLTSNWRQDHFLRGWWQQKTLQFKTTFIAIAIGIVPVVALEGVTYFISNQAFEEQVKKEIIKIADSRKDELQLFLNNIYNDIQTIIIAELEIFNNPVISKTEKNAVLDNYLVNHSSYKNITALDLQGNIIAQSRGETRSQEIDKQYIKKVLERKNPFYSEPIIDENGVTIDLVVPIINILNKQIIGIIRTTISVQEMQEILFGNEFKLEQEVYVIDSQKNIFIGSDQNVIGQNLKEYFPLLAAEIIKKEENRDNQETPEETQTIISQGEHQGIDKLIAANFLDKTLREKYQINWITVVTVDENVAFSYESKFLLTISLGIMITVILVGFVAVIISRRVVRPITEVSQAAASIGKGDFDIELNMEGQDEITVLANNINQMASQLKKLLQEQTLSVIQSGLLKNITLKMAEAFESQVVFNIAAAEIREALNSDRVIVYRFDDNWQGTIIAESVNEPWPKALGATIHDPCFAEKYVQKYLEGRIQAVTDIYQANLTQCHLQQLEPFGVKANLVAPIILQGQLIGLLIAHQCSNPRNWEKGEIEFFAQIANQIGPAIQRTSLLERQRLDVQLGQNLKDITINIAGAFNTETVFEIAVHETRIALNTDRVIVYRFDPQLQGTIIAESVLDEWPKSLGNIITDPCFAERYAELYNKGRVQAVSDIYNSGLLDCHIRELEPFAVRANLVAPIIVENELQGLLIAHECRAPRQWGQEEIDFFVQIATQIGPALERVNLLAQLRLAEEEQRQAKEQLQKRALELLMQVDPVSRGDLTIRAQVTADEIGTIADSYNATIENLRKIVTQVKNAAQEVAEITIDNQDSVNVLSEDALNQTEDIMQALNQIQIMTDSITAVAANAEQAEVVVRQANQTVELGEEAMNRTVDGILAIRETVAETAKKVKRLGESSQKISKVVNLISSFADQTNLLALNASIEAAHAGEEGRGFAVVADEVRSLARQSAAATAEIEKVVAEIQTETNEVVAAMEFGTEQVVTGTKLVEETRQNLNQITAASAQINELVTAITRAALEQSQSSEVVAQTIADVATIANKTSMSATNVSDSFKQLLLVAQQLQKEVGQFKVK